MRCQTRCIIEARCKQLRLIEVKLARSPSTMNFTSIAPTRYLAQYFQTIKKKKTVAVSFAIVCAMGALPLPIKPNIAIPGGR